MGVAVVTGANGGMGKEICKTLLAAGHRVVAVCRPGQSGRDFVQTMQGPITLLEMDLAQPNSVCEAANRLLEQGEPIDILMNNAGMLGWKKQPVVTPQGVMEMHYVVNCLSPMLFTTLLKPLLHPGSRVVNTVSCTVWIGKIPRLFPLMPNYFNRFVLYSDSKYALLLLSLRLAREWSSEGITVNTADPGIVDTPIIRMHNWIDPLTDLFFRPIIRRPAKGAATALYLALDPAVAGCTGGLYAGKKRQKRVKRIEIKEQEAFVWKCFSTFVTLTSKTNNYV